MGSFSKKEQIVILIIILIIFSTLAFKLFIKDLFNQEENELGLVSANINDELISSDQVNDDFSTVNSLIMVHISGQVYSPGIFQLVVGDRVIDAVNLAGGLTKDADLDRINLAKKIVDEEKIYIPKYDEDMSNKEVLLSQNSSTNNTGKININICSLNDLQDLPGIGEVIANRIIEYRSSTPFRSIDELKNVSGIGDKKFEGIKELITTN